MVWLRVVLGLCYVWLVSEEEMERKVVMRGFIFYDCLVIKFFDCVGYLIGL